MIELFSIRGEWPMSYRLDFLLLYHLMPNIQNGFDYLVISHDTFAAFRNLFLTLIGGSGV